MGVILKPNEMTNQLDDDVQTRISAYCMLSLEASRYPLDPNMKFGVPNNITDLLHLEQTLQVEFAIVDMIPC